MKCFIHLNNDSSTYCSVCRRPICNACSNNHDQICPRCTNFTHKTIFDYNKKLLKLLIPIMLIRITTYYDTLNYVISTKNLFDFDLVVTIILLITFIPFCFNIIKYGFINAVRYQVVGKKDAIEIADDKKWDNVWTYIIGILTFIVCAVLHLIITPLFIITDIIRLCKAIKDISFHKTKILTETEIKNLR